MSLNASLQIGRSALLTSQAAIQVAGDNMANAATRGFHRRSVHLAPLRGQMNPTGHFIGQGVSLLAIRREIDTALQARFRNATSKEHGSLIDQQFLTAMETLQNELTDNDLSTAMSAFFNAFSELANSPSDVAMRGVVIQKGQSLASRIATMRKDYTAVRSEVDAALGMNIDKVNDLLDQVALLNQQITTTEIGEAEVASLRDHHDTLLDELAQHLDITVINRSNGAVDVLVSSTPILLGSESRGIALRTESVSGDVKVSVRVKADGTKLNVQDGAIGALLTQRDETIDPMIASLDTFASQLIFHVNKLHSQGQGLKGFANLTGTYALQSASDGFNSAEAGLPFEVKNGSFFIHVTHKDTGVRTTHEISANGETSLDDLVNQINTVVGVPNVTAGVGLNNTLTLSAASGYEFSFSDDTSGVLAALGMNTFFTGSDATDININALLVDDPALLAVGEGHVSGSNGTALALADLQNVSLAELGGASLREFWQRSVSWLAVRTNAANADVETSQMVRENLGAQIQAVSGVSIDEESINLLTFQRQYQAAARYIGIIDETMQTLIALGR